jgi:hypothetical protein
MDSRPPSVYGSDHVALVFGLHFPLGIQIQYPLDSNRRYFEVADWDVLASESWKFRDRKSYGAQVYSKTALTLATLERLSRGVGIVDMQPPSGSR